MPISIPSRFGSGSSGGQRARQAAEQARAARPGSGAPSLPGLSAADFADLSARRRNATSTLQQALANRNAERGRIKTGFQFNLDQLKSTVEDQRRSLLDQLGAQGMALQPRFAGKGQRELRDLFAEEKGRLQADKAERLAVLEQMMQEARRRRDAELAAIEADEVRRRSELSRLIQGA